MTSGLRLLWKPETASQTVKTARSWERGSWAKVLQDVDLDEITLEDAIDLNLAFSNKGTISSSAIKGDNPISKCYENFWKAKHPFQHVWIVGMQYSYPSL